jgi:protocatechuate 3,4-dioxygenase beta subunit
MVCDLGPPDFWSSFVFSVSLGDTIASEGKGRYLYVRGRVLDTSKNPIPLATIETWETDEFGFYDTQYVNREKPDCRGRLKTDAEGRYEFRAVVPVAYPIPGDVWFWQKFI